MGLRRTTARRVRMHLEDGGGGRHGPSVEGVQMHRRPVGGHYILHQPRYLEQEDQTVPLDGHLEVPSRRVWFIQILDEGERP